MQSLMWIGVLVVVAFSCMPVAHADTGDTNPPIECPDTHAHVWHQDQCVDIADPFEFPGSGHGGSCGIICGIGKILGGLI